MLRFILSCCLLYSAFVQSTAQSLGFKLPVGKNSSEIPFEYENNFIIVSVQLNHFLPLKFIWDTGAEHTILTKKVISDLLTFSYDRTFTVLGSDLQTELTAYLSRNIHVRSEEMTAPNQDILVLKEDYFRFEEYTGTEIHGILGADLFKRYIVKINYRRRTITLYNPLYYKPPKADDDYQKFDLEIIKNKPYINANVQLQNDTTINTKLLLDTGASLSLLLNTSTHPDFRTPPNVVRSNIAAGLGGNIEGFVGRIKQFELGDFKLNQVISNFQETSELLDTSYMNGRNGIIGNEILYRFSVIIDYPKAQLYLKANKKFKQKFKFDRSGISIIAAGAYKNQYIVQQVLSNSPAEEAGVQIGDRITTINGIPSFFLSLRNITALLQAKKDKKIRLSIKRNKEKYKIRFLLRDLI